MNSPVRSEVQLAAAALKENRLDDALGLLNSAIAKAPDDFAANHLMGVALGKAGRGPEALACLLKATHLNPASAAAQTHLGMAYAAADKAELARRSYETALRLDPNFAPAQSALSRLTDTMPAPAPVGRMSGAPVANAVAAPTPWTSSSQPKKNDPVTQITSKPSKNASLMDDIAQVQKEAKNEKYDIDWGPMMLQIGGAIVFVIGVGLWIGNVSGFFPTFPGLGYITMLIGGAMWKAA